MLRVWVPITFCAKRFVRNVLCETFCAKRFGQFLFWNHILNLGLGWPGPAGLGWGLGWGCWAGLVGLGLGAGLGAGGLGAGGWGLGAGAGGWAGGWGAGWGWGWGWGLGGLGWVGAGLGGWAGLGLGLGAGPAGAGGARLGRGGWAVGWGLPLKLKLVYSKMAKLCPDRNMSFRMANSNKQFLFISPLYRVWVRGFVRVSFLALYF